MSLLLRPLQLAINTALKQDIETCERLAQFEQRLLAIIITDLRLELYVSFSQQTIQLSTAKPQQTADLQIKASSMVLLSLAQNPEQLFSPEIEIIGDVQFAKQLQDVFDGFDFDWEQQVANLTGDLIAQPLTFGLRKGFAWLQQTHQSGQIKLSAYLREQAQLLPNKDQLDSYMQKVDQLNADCDRLEARIKRLQTQHSINT